MVFMEIWSAWTAARFTVIQVYLKTSFLGKLVYKIYVLCADCRLRVHKNMQPISPVFFNSIIDSLEFFPYSMITY